LINDDGKCSTLAAILGGFVAQADWPGPNVGSQLVLLLLRLMKHIALVTPGARMQDARDAQ